jgi:hypothetical protein
MKANSLKCSKVKKAGLPPKINLEAPAEPLIKQPAAKIVRLMT